MNKYFLTLLAGMLLGSFSGYSQTEEGVQAADTTIVRQLSEPDVPILTLSTTDIEGDAGSHDISSLLQGSRDVYVSTAGFTFGNARYRIRGYDSENVLVMINGIPVNDPETGRAFYSTWGGLNDATRMTVSHSGIGVSRENFGGIGGANNITTRASLYGAGNRVTYSNSNRGYTHRVMYTHSTGMQANGWALTLSGSRRLAQESYVKGTFYDAWGYFLSAERKLNERHSLGLIAFGAPSKTGRPGVGTQEMYELTGDNFYNPNWGYQNGEVRNSRVNNYHTPYLILTHYYEPDRNTLVQTSAAYTFGRGGASALNWFDANDPRPDYYRYLPSYYKNDPQQFEYYSNLWKNSPEVRQLDWDAMYQANFKNLYTQTDVNGIAGNNITGNRAKYIVEERRTDRNQFTFNSNIQHKLNPRTTLSGGINASLSKTHQFKVMDDLLGADWWVDIDQFALRDSPDPIAAQNDILNPNRLIREGDRFGYDFTGNINNYDAFAQAEFMLPKWDFYGALNLSHTSFWRTGHMQNGRFQENSYGDSEKHNFFNYGLKGGLTYKLTGRHYITANTAYITRAPYFRDAYISSRVRDEVIENLGSETITGGDLNYIIRTPLLKSRLGIFYSQFKDQTWSRSFYHEEFRTFVNYIMTGVDQTHAGAELGIDINLSPTLSMSLVGGTGNYIYTSRPQVTIARDNDQEILADQRTVYWENYKVGGMTHTAASIGMRYNSPKFWFIGYNLNFFDDIYMDINPDRRTVGAVENLVDTDPQWRSTLDQEKLPSAYTLDIFGGKSWLIQRKYNISLNLSINNVLDNKEFSIGGFEQLRYDSQDMDKFPSKYFYSYGRTYFINLAFRI